MLKIEKLPFWAKFKAFGVLDISTSEYQKTPFNRLCVEIILIIC